MPKEQEQKNPRFHDDAQLSEPLIILAFSAAGWGAGALKVTKLLAPVFWPAAEISAMDRRERFSCRWQRSLDCVFCAVNNKVGADARGKLMSNHKDLGKGFACGRRSSPGRGRAPGTLQSGWRRRQRSHNNESSARAGTVHGPSSGELLAEDEEGLLHQRDAAEPQRERNQDQNQEHVSEMWHGGAESHVKHLRFWQTWNFTCSDRLHLLMKRPESDPNETEPDLNET